MTSIGWWGLISVVALVVSAILVRARREGGRWMVLSAAVIVIAAEGLVLWDRARKLNSVYRYEEPLLTTVLVVGVPVLAVAAVVSWASSRKWRASAQMAAGMVTGVATYLIAALLGYALL